MFLFATQDELRVALFDAEELVFIKGDGTLSPFILSRIDAYRRFSYPLIPTWIPR